MSKKEINIQKIKNVKLIAKDYPKQFNKDRQPLPEISAAPLKTAFTSGEVQAGIKHLQSNKNAGKDNIKAKQIKYETENIAKDIATIYNEIARTGKHPNEINQGVLTVI